MQRRANGSSVSLLSVSSKISAHRGQRAPFGKVDT
jgi:hypothetical protein